MNKLFQRAFVLSTILCCVASLAPRIAHAKGEEGKELFKQICVACHTINGGKLVGPDLANVHKRRPEEWIIRFVKSSQAVIKAGDPYAVQLFDCIGAAEAPYPRPHCSPRKRRASRNGQDFQQRRRIRVGGPRA